MIKSPAAFPFPGSYALHVVAGTPELVRVLEWIGPQGRVPFEDDATALVAFPLRIGASGNTQVPLATLIDATPLDADERQELSALEAKLAGSKRPRKADLARELQLRSRDVQSTVLEKLIRDGMRRKLIGEDAGHLALGMAA